MLSSRDTPFSEDGWALIIEDMRRLNLLIAGGANDLNAGAIDADQQAINDLSTALNAHEIDSDAHAALLALYLKRSDYTAGFSAVTFQAYDSTTYTSLVYPVVLKPTAVFDTGSGWNATTGIYTVPTTGYYGLMFSAAIEAITSAAGNEDFLFIVSNNGSSINGGGGSHTFRAKAYAATGISGQTVQVFISTIASLTAGDQVKVTGGLNASGSLTSYSVSGITFSAFRIG